MAINYSFSQQQAIRHKDGPLLVLAGPGSGKTSVITARTAHLIEQHRVPPEQILIITFTRAAANELYTRLCKSENPNFLPVTVRTFHSFFYQILQHAYGKTLPSILSTKEQIQIIQRLLEKNRIFPSNHLVAKEYLSVISRRKSSSHVLDSKENINNENCQTSNTTHKNNLYSSSTSSQDIISCIHSQYEQQLQIFQKIDMDDIQLKTYFLLKRNKEICGFWQKQFSYVMIDEYQDISDIQFQCMHLLFGQRQNLFVVGDDDQSIYGFRGSKPQIMLNFQTHYPKGHNVLLETNYRCSKVIVKSALNLINHNEERFHKELLPFHKGQAEPVVLYEFSNHNAQLEYVVKEARNKTNFAIFYRNNRQVQGLIDLFTLHKIPFYSKETLPSIHSHWSVQELLSTVCLATDKTKARKICWFKDTQSKEQWDKHMKMVQAMPPYGGTMYIRKAMGYEEYLKDYAKKMDLPETEYIKVLDSFTFCIKNINSWAEYKHFIDTKEKLMKKNIKHREGIFLTTMHGAKGLEFDEVCILDVNEGIVPYKKIGLVENLEEERRLFYVAITRAKRKLQLLYVNNAQQSLQPSRFLYEAFQTKNLQQSNQLFTFRSSSLTNSSYSLASNHSSKASATTSYSSSSSILSKTGSSSSFSE